MTLDQLKDIFKFQTTKTEDYTPKDTLDYMLFNGQDRVPATCPVNEMDKLVQLLEGFQFEGYRDKTPLFLKPDDVL